MIGTVSVSTVIFLSSVGLYLFGHNTSDHEIRQLIEGAYSIQRPGGGRLSAASYTPIGVSALATTGLGRAQILLLSQPDSRQHQRLQGLAYLAAGEWRKFVELTNDRSSRVLADSATLNNVGASFLALSESDPTFLLKALDAFERASKLDSHAPEPLFNLVITYRKLQFPKLAEQSLRLYSALD